MLWDALFRFGRRVMKVNGRQLLPRAGRIIVALATVSMFAYFIGCMGGEKPPSPLAQVEVLNVLYSGRESPQIEITQEEANELLAKIKGLSKVTAPPPLWEANPFGRFMIINRNFNLFQSGLPIVVEVKSGIAKIGSTFFEDTVGLEAWLRSKFRQRISRSLKHVPSVFSYGPRQLPYEPEKWNAPDPPLPSGNTIGDLARFSDYLSKLLTQLWNNCYNYAVDIPTWTSAQPGDGGDKPMDPSDSFDCDEVSGAAQADGLTPIDCDRDCPESSHKVMLFVDNTGAIQDYHWYRQNEDGTWSHKPGGTPVTDKDASGNNIIDPRTADRNYGRFGDTDGDGDVDEDDDELNYSEFCGCFCVKKKMVKIK